MTTPHVPVLIDGVMAALAPMQGKTVVDGTFGAGGYTRAFLDAGASVIALRPRTLRPASLRRACPPTASAS